MYIYVYNICIYIYIYIYINFYLRKSFVFKFSYVSHSTHSFLFSISSCSALPSKCFLYVAIFRTSLII